MFFCVATRLQTLHINQSPWSHWSPEFMVSWNCLLSHARCIHWSFIYLLVYFNLNNLPQYSFGRLRLPCLWRPAECFCLSLICMVEATALVQSRWGHHGEPVPCGNESWVDFIKCHWPPCLNLIFSNIPFAVQNLCDQPGVGGRLPERITLLEYKIEIYTLTKGSGGCRQIPRACSSGDPNSLHLWSQGHRLQQE